MTLFRNKYRVESARLQGYDYSSPGYYFVTICTKNRANFFGEILDKQMHFSEIGLIADQYWRDIPKYFDNVSSDAYIVMPNHVHGIICIAVDTRNSAYLRGNVNSFGPLKSKSLSAIINAYKSSVTRWCKKNNHPEFFWQPRFYDHIIRGEISLNKIRNYIINNPGNWQEDNESLDNPTKQAKVREYENNIDQTCGEQCRTMVYKLHDLTPEEIKIVKESVAPKGETNFQKTG